MNPSLTTGSTHGHDSTATALDGSLDVSEVKIDGSLHSDEFRDTLGGITQYLVCQFEGILYGNLGVGINIAETLVVDDKQGIHVLAHFFYTLQSLDNFLSLLEVERYGDDANGKDAHPFGNTGNDRCGTRTRSTTHSGSNKNHLGSVVQQFLDVFLGILSLTSSHFGICPCTQTTLSEHDFYRHRRLG